MVRKRPLPKYHAASCTKGSGVCLVASRSFDGLGHQLEAKLSCIAATRHFGFEYVHAAFKGKAHRENLGSLERTLLPGFASAFRRYDRQRMQSRPRAPAFARTFPFLRPCTCCTPPPLSSSCSALGWGNDTRSSSDSWLLQAATNLSFRRSTCCGDTVHVADNCFDFLYCHPDWPGIWTNVLPDVHRMFGKLSLPADDAANGSSRWGATVVLHIRCGDAFERALPIAYYARAIREMRETLGRGQHTRPPLFRVQTDAPGVHIETLLSGPDVIFDYANHADNGSLALAFQRMVSADVLVIARSSLSMAAALLNNGSVWFPSCFMAHRRPLPHWRVRSCNDMTRSTCIRSIYWRANLSGVLRAAGVSRMGVDGCAPPDLQHYRQLLASHARRSNDSMPGTGGGWQYWERRFLSSPYYKVHLPKVEPAPRPAKGNALVTRLPRAVDLLAGDLSQVTRAVRSDVAIAASIRALPPSVLPPWSPAHLDDPPQPSSESGTSTPHLLWTTTHVVAAIGVALAGATAVCGCSCRHINAARGMGPNSLRSASSCAIRRRRAI